MESWIVWCEFNDEQNMLEKALGDLAFSIQGSTPDDLKIEYEERWRTGERPVLITKVKCFGFGMNWQNCNNMIFCGLSDSYERFYQAIRRCYRFGQTKEVNVHVVLSEKEISVLENIKRKEELSQKMSSNMVALTSEILKNEIRNTTRNEIKYNPKQEIQIPSWLEEVI